MYDYVIYYKLARCVKMYNSVINSKEKYFTKGLLETD